MKENDYITIIEAAKILKCTRQFISKLIKGDKLLVVKFSERKTLISRIAIDNLFNQNKHESSKG